MIIELAYANVNLPIAAICALVMRASVASWSIPPVVKLAALPLAPLAFFLDRRMFLRGAAVALGAVAASIVVAPAQWSAYLDFLSTAREPEWWTNLSHGIAFAPRLLVAVGLGVAAIRWRRVAPLAVLISLPIVWLSALSILVATVVPIRGSAPVTGEVPAAGGCRRRGHSRPGGYIGPGRTAPVDARHARPRLALRAGRLALFALAVLGALAGGYVLWRHLMTDPIADVRAYYDAATRLNPGQTCTPPTPTRSHGLLPYPPLLAILLRPVARLPFTRSRGGRRGPRGLLRLLRRLGGDGGPGSPWACWGSRSAGRWHRPGPGPHDVLMAIGQPWSVAFAGKLKLFPMLIAIWWLGRRDYQAVGAMIGWTLILGLAQFVLAPAGIEGVLFGSGARPGGRGPEHQPVCDLAVSLGHPRGRRGDRRRPPGADQMGLAGRGRALDPRLAAPARVHADEPACRGARAGPARG